MRLVNGVRLLVITLASVVSPPTVSALVIPAFVAVALPRVENEVFRLVRVAFVAPRLVEVALVAKKLVLVALVEVLLVDVNPVIVPVAELKIEIVPLVEKRLVEAILVVVAFVAK